MKSKDIALLVNSAFSLIELIIRMRNERPDDFAGEEERLAKLNELTKELQSKPKDYLQTWEPEDDT